MEPFRYQQGELYCETVRMEDVARRYGTPVVVYAAGALRENLARVRAAFGGIEPAIRFPVQTLPSPGVLRVLSAEGCGMAALSGGEVERAWLARTPMTEVHFAGVGKSDDDIRAALDGIYSPLFQAGVTVDGRPPYYRGPTGWMVAESLEEVERIAVIATSLRVTCRIAIRVNTALEAPADEPVPPGAVASKFGVSRSAALEAFRRFEFRQHVRLAGVVSHVGQVSHDADLFGLGVRRLLDTASDIREAGHDVELIDIGGGMAAVGVSASAPTPEDYAAAVVPMLGPWREAGATIAVQPGRPIAASAGVMLIGVREVKAAEDRLIVVCDTGLSAANRPADVDGFRVVWPITTDPGLEPPRPGMERLDTTGLEWCDIVGPGGRDADLIGRGRLLPPVKPGDRLAILAAGADALHAVQRGSDHALPAEVLIEGRNVLPLRPRAGLVEQLAPELGPLEKL